MGPVVMPEPASTATEVGSPKPRSFLLHCTQSEPSISVNITAADAPLSAASAKASASHPWVPPNQRGTLSRPLSSRNSSVYGGATARDHSNELAPDNLVEGHPKDAGGSHCERQVNLVALFQDQPNLP